MKTESSATVDARDEAGASQCFTQNSLPRFTLHQVAEQTSITLAELLHYVEVGILAVHQRETCIEVEKPGDGMAQLLLAGNVWTGIAKMQNEWRKDVTGMEGLADETAVKIVEIRYRRCTLQDVPGMHAAPENGYLVSAEAIAGLIDSLAPQESGKPLDTRERTTLLCIIGALAVNAKLDLSQPMKAGDAIAAMMPDVKLSGRTIGEHLKAVREAMDSRKG